MFGKMYWVKTPKYIKAIFPSCIWEVKGNERVLYLTFDDGPDENISSDVLDLLDEYQAKATFFCVGEKVVQNPELYQQLIDNGHSFGNHAYNHSNGFLTSTSDYLANVERAAQYIKSPLFRPPYGKMKRAQFRALNKKYRIIMWDVMPGDFDPGVSRDKVLQRAIKHSKPGSILVFHDNAKFADKMMFALRGTLDFFSREGYRFQAIPMTTKSSIS